jgi:MraZ protein
MRFRGTYDHSLDDKNRLTIPSRFREHFRTGVVLTKSVDGCIEAWRPEDFEQHVDDATDGLGAMSPQLRETLRLLEGSAYDTQLDKVGRVALTGALVEHGGLGRDVTLVGTRRCLEIWDRGRWAQLSPGLPETVRAFTAEPATPPPGDLAS